MAKKVTIYPPTKLPINSTILYSFLLHYFNANNLIWGVFLTLFVIYYIIVLIVKNNEKIINIEVDKDLFVKQKENEK